MFLLCACMCVSCIAWTYRHACVCAWMFMCVHVCGPQGTTNHFLLWDRVYHWPGTCQVARLAGQWAQGTCLSPLPSSGRTSVPLAQLLYVGPSDITQVLVLVQKHFTYKAVFPALILFFSFQDFWVLRGKSRLNLNTLDSHGFRLLLRIW